MGIESIMGLMVVCLLVEGFFSGSEIGVVSADRMKLRHKAAKGHRGAQIAVNMLKKPEWLLSTTLVGTNIAIVSNTTLATLLSMELFGAQYSWVAILFVAPLIWVFGEIVPKSIFQQRADVLTPKVIYVLWFFSYLFFPILVIFTTLTKIVTRMVKGKEDKSPFTLKQELDLMLQMDSDEGDILPMEKVMLRRAFTYGKSQVRDVMKPYVDVSSVANSTLCDQALKIAGEKGHPLLPVYSDRVDRVVGQVNTLDLLGNAPGTSIEDFIKPIRFVYASKKLDDLLKEFQSQGDRIAIVVDEYGSAQGLISMKDIVERIVGDIESDHQTPHHQERVVKDVEQDGDNAWRVNPRLDLTALQQGTGVELPRTGSYETLSGFLLEHFGDLPAKDAVLEYEGVRYTVLERSGKRIEKVHMQMAS